MTAAPLPAAVRHVLAGFAFALVALGGMELHAQAFAGHDSNAPVNFEAGNISLEDRENRVILTGGVTVTQAGLEVRSRRMLVDYSDAGDLSISRITATGGVRVRRGNESARGDVAVYDLQRRLITMAGNVALRRGGDSLSGGRLTIDLASGRASVDGRGVTSGESSSGRVSGTFTVSQGSRDNRD